MHCAEYSAIAEHRKTRTHTQNGYNKKDVFYVKTTGRPKADMICSSLYYFYIILLNCWLAGWMFVWHVWVVEFATTASVDT